MAKKSNPKTSALTGPQQIAILQNLTPAAVGFILDISGRTLRDQYHLPRNADGTYDAREVLNWAKGRTPTPAVDDDTMERVVQAASMIGENFVTPGLVDLLGNLDRDHGDAGLALFARTLLEEWAEIAGPLRPVKSDAEVRREAMDRCDEQYKKEIENEILEELRGEAEANLQLVIVCDVCGRVRHGRNWRKETPQSETRRPRWCHLCPDCRAKGHE